MHESADEHTLMRILGNNEELAAHNREHFDELGLWAINLMSAPGAGKTRLLENILSSWTEIKPYVIEGDMVGELDAIRLRRTGAEVLQICTGRSCHLDAQMVGRVLHGDSLQGKDVVFIENVGNLVCPAEFWLGEHMRIVLLSVTEGDDKPIKYPVIFHKCDAVIFTKCDLLPYVDFNVATAASNVNALNPKARIFEISAINQQGIPDFVSWLKSRLVKYKDERRSELCASPSRPE